MPRGPKLMVGTGLFAAAFAWAMHQQTGIILASWVCSGAAHAIWLTTAVTGLLLLGGIILSGLGLSAARAGRLPEETARPRRFIAIVSLMAGALFLFALGLQAAAAIFLPGCVG
jgi:hypothetical protein